MIPILGVAVIELVVSDSNVHVDVAIPVELVPNQRTVFSFQPQLLGGHQVVAQKIGGKLEVLGLERQRRDSIESSFDAAFGAVVLFDGIDDRFIDRSMEHRELGGVRVGSRIEVTGTVGVHQNRLAILNPDYRLRP